MFAHIPFWQRPSRGLARVFLLALMLTYIIPISSQDTFSLDQSLNSRLLNDMKKSEKAVNRTLDEEKKDTPRKSPQEDHTQKCPNLTFFDKVLSNAEKAFLKDKEDLICKDATLDCCGRDQLLQIANWWEGKQDVGGSVLSRSDMRHQRLQAIAYYSEYFMGKSDHLKTHAKAVAGQKKAADHDCFDAAIELEKLVPANLQELLINYKKEMAKCWTHNNLIQTTVLCDVCNSKLQDSIDFKSKKLYLNKESCPKVIETCYYMTKLNIGVVFPYIKLLEVLTRCSADGKINHEIESLTLASSGLLQAQQMPDDVKD